MGDYTASGIWYPDTLDTAELNTLFSTMASSIENGIGAKTASLTTTFYNTNAANEIIVPASGVTIVENILTYGRKHGNTVSWSALFTCGAAQSVDTATGQLVTAFTVGTLTAPFRPSSEAVQLKGSTYRMVGGSVTSSGVVVLRSCAGTDTTLASTQQITLSGTYVIA